MKLVVGGEGEESSKPGSKGEEDLRGRVNPYLQAGVKHKTSVITFFSITNQTPNAIRSST